MVKTARLILAAGFILALVVLNAQNEKTSLQQRKARLEQEIENTNKLLNQTQTSKKKNLNQLYLVDRKIKHREQLIQTIDEEVGSLESRINTLNDTISKLSRNLTDLKQEYAGLICSTYRNKNAFNRLAFIFASRDFNQAYRRIKYLQQYSSYRKAQAAMLVETQQKLGTKKLETENQKSAKMTLKHRRESEVERLSAEKDQKNKAISSLTRQEKELLKKLRENEMALNKLKAAIEAVIAEEIRKASAEKARRDAAATSKEVKTAPAVAAKPAPPSVSMSMSAEETALSNTFEGNKGKLPWPLESGNITSTFGEHPHPEYSGIRVKNNGIDISTKQDQKARAVFDGVVSSVMSITSLHYVVIVRHGEYLTVYSNLADVDVKKGDKIRTRQALGTVYTDPVDKSSQLHFELWKGTLMQNPQSWIRR